MHGQALCAGTYIYTWGELEVSINRVRRDGEGKTSQVCAPPPGKGCVFKGKKKPKTAAWKEKLGAAAGSRSGWVG